MTVGASRPFFEQDDESAKKAIGEVGIRATGRNDSSGQGYFSADATATWHWASSGGSLSTSTGHLGQLDVQRSNFSYHSRIS